MKKWRIKLVSIGTLRTQFNSRFCLMCGKTTRFQCAATASFEGVKRGFDVLLMTTTFLQKDDARRYVSDTIHDRIRKRIFHEVDSI